MSTKTNTMRAHFSVSLIIDLDAWVDTYGQESLEEARIDAPSHLGDLLAYRVLTLSRLTQERLAEITKVTMKADGQPIQPITIEYLED